MQQPIPVEPLPPEVKILDPIHGCLPTLKFLDYNLYDVSIFFDFRAEKYMKKIKLDNGMEVVKYKEWTKQLQQSGLMSLLDILHFEHSPQANNYIIFLLSKFHDSFLWVDKLYPLTERLMRQLTRLPHIGEDLGESLKAKDVDTQ